MKIMMPNLQIEFKNHSHYLVDGKVLKIMSIFDRKQEDGERHAWNCYSLQVPKSHDRLLKINLIIRYVSVRMDDGQNPMVSR